MFVITKLRSRTLQALVLAVAFLVCPTQAAESEPVKLSDPFVSEVLISPDSRYTVFVRDVNTLFSVVSNNGTAVKISETNNGTPFTQIYTVGISPNSRRVVFMARLNNAAPLLLYSVPISGGTPVQLNAPLAAGEGVRSFAVSNDSQRVVYFKSSMNGEQASDLYSALIDGSGAVVKLSGSRTGDQQLSIYSNYLLSPDSQHVVYRIDEGQQDKVQSSLYSVSISGGTPIKLEDPFPSYNYLITFVFSPDSAYLVYNRKTVLSAPNELFAVSLSGGLPRKLSTPTGYAGIDAKFLISADSKYVVFVAFQNTSPYTVDLYSTPVGGNGTAVQIGTSVGYSASIPVRITPDSQRVIYKVATTNMSKNYVDHLYSVPITGGASIRLDNLDHGVDSLFYISPDSQHVVYMAFWLYSAPINGSSPPVEISPSLDPVDRISQYDITITPDSRSVIYRTLRANGENDLFSTSLFKQDAKKLNGMIDTVGESYTNEFAINFRLSSNGAYAVFRGASARDQPFALYKVIIGAPFFNPTNRVFLPIARN